MIFSQNNRKKCPHCNGTGKINKPVGGRIISDANGKPARIVDRQVAIELCNRCRGTGKL